MCGGQGLSGVITEVTYLEFLVLQFYLIYDHDDSHVKRDDQARKPDFLQAPSYQRKYQ